MYTKFLKMTKKTRCRNLILIKYYAKALGYKAQYAFYNTLVNMNTLLNKVFIKNVSLFNVYRHIYNDICNNPYSVLPYVPEPPLRFKDFSVLPYFSFEEISEVHQDYFYKKTHSGSKRLLTMEDSEYKSFKITLNIRDRIVLHLNNGNYIVKRYHDMYPEEEVMVRTETHEKKKPLNNPESKGVLVRYVLNWEALNELFDFHSTIKLDDCGDDFTQKDIEEFKGVLKERAAESFKGIRLYDLLIRKPIGG